MTFYKILIIGLLFISSEGLVGQMEMHDKLSYSMQIILEHQSYLEKSYHNSRYYDVEKSCATSVTYGLDINKEKNVTKRFDLDYGIGLKLISQEYEFNEITSSHSEYRVMASSKVNCLFLSASSRLFYNKQNSKKFHLAPFIGIGVNLPISKYEKIKQLKSGFSDVIDPKFRFKYVVPAISVGFLLIYKPTNMKYGFAIGPSINNNSKYFKESVGILTYPLSISINLSIIRKYQDHIIPQLLKD